MPCGMCHNNTALHAGDNKVFYSHQSLSGESTTTECGVNYQLLNIMRKPNMELLVAVDHIQLWTMASEMVDPIDWSHLPTSCAVPPRAPRIGRCNCELGHRKVEAYTRNRGSNTRPRVCQANALPVRPLRVPSETNTNSVRRT